MIILHVTTSGLGNFIFQYGAALNLSKKIGKPIQFHLENTLSNQMPEDIGFTGIGFDELSASLSSFDIDLIECKSKIDKAPTGLIWNKGYNVKVNGNLIPCISDTVINRYRLNKKLLGHEGPAYLSGQFLNVGHIKQVKEELYKTFLTKNNIAMARDKLNRQPDEKLVAVHVRRGDFCAPSTRNRYYICPSSYFLKASQAIERRFSKDKFKYIVLSDDPAWAKKNTLTDTNKKVVYIEGNSANVDWLLIACCDHHIISNSTFSWTAAWLGKKENSIIIGPNKWMNTFFSPHSLIAATQRII